LKEQCPHNCCSNTEIKLSVIDLLKINETLGVTYANANFKFGDASAHLYIDQKTGYPYAVMNNKNNSCPLLKNSLCIIHEKTLKDTPLGRTLKDKGLSTSALPLICRSYPLAIFYPENGKLELNSGCKGVTEMKWEYVSKTPELIEAMREASIYKAIIKKDMIKQIQNNTLLQKTRELLEAITDDELEKTTFS